MQEVEVKFKLTQTSYGKVLEVFKEKYNVSFSEKKQKDDIFLLPEQVDEPIVAGSKIMRVRYVEKGDELKKLLTLKVQREQALVSDEYEFEISSDITAKDMLSALGWCNDVTVIKTRNEGRVGEYNVCIDDVKELGVFIELEKLVDGTHPESISKIQNEMKQFLEALRLSGEISMVPYDTQLKNLRKNAK